MDLTDPYDLLMSEPLTMNLMIALTAVLHCYPLPPPHPSAFL